jgi:Raf kinase inhibitor-like YbhB/YbcL family protein
MVLGYTPHAAPMQFVFYTGGSFPKEFRGDAFATMRGSWNRAQPSGYEIVRIHFENGHSKAFEPFVTGFLTDNGRTHIARPVGLAVARDGSLLMADDANGVLYRVAYTGTSHATSAARLTPPADAMRAQTMKGAGQPIVMQRAEIKGNPDIQVRSGEFDAGATMPAKLSEYADAVSPQVSWSSVPEAKSYALVMEDPDAKPVTPFVHWIIWNIPAEVTQLPEGLQKQARLTAPDGVMQGRTSRGSVGYFGPHPPAGDPPHHYHIQVLALDAMLDTPGGRDRDEMLKAAAAHVIAKGELVGMYRQASAPTD